MILEEKIISGKGSVVSFSAAGGVWGHSEPLTRDFRGTETPKKI